MKTKENERRDQRTVFNGSKLQRSNVVHCDFLIQKTMLLAFKYKPLDIFIEYWLLI